MEEWKYEIQNQGPATDRTPGATPGSMGAKRLLSPPLIFTLEWM